MKPAPILLAFTLALTASAAPLPPAIAPALGAGVTAAHQLRAAPTPTVAIPVPSLQGGIPVPVTPRPVVAPGVRPVAASPASR